MTQQKSLMDRLTRFGFRDKVCHRLLPLYRAVGLDFLVKKSEKVLGPLTDEVRSQIDTIYTLAMGHLGGGIIAEEPVLYVFSAGYALLGAVHHRAMSRFLRDENL